eukprot:COSAG05_NODE_5428_length_1177_cov_1.782931_1_plen_75_part_00
MRCLSSSVSTAGRATTAAALEVETADGDGSSVQEDAGEQQLEQESERAPAAKRQRCREGLPGRSKAGTSASWTN